MLLANKAIGTCAYMGGVPAVLESFCWSWGQMVAYTTENQKPGEYVHFDRARLSLHDAARNDLAQRMRGDWLLMMDTDHAFEPDIVWRMVDRLETAKIDVLTAVYQYKFPPHSPVLYVKADDLYAPIGSWRGDGDGTLDLFQVDAAGAGCLLVRRSVFDRIEQELGEGPFDRIFPLGEDMSFFKRCEKLGIKVFCDVRIESHHLQVRPISLADYDRTQVKLGEEQRTNAFAMKARA